MTSTLSTRTPVGPVRATGLIHKTTDGGNTWALKLTKTGTHFRCIGFASSTRGFAGNLGVGSYDSAVTDSNVLYQTFDGGDTWKNVPGFSVAAPPMVKVALLG
jgi:photosystem II stability/assembly factor-like uncharacterized protein